MSSFDPKDDFQRRFGTHITTGVTQQRAPRSSLQRRIMDTGQAERLQQSEQDSESSASPADQQQPSSTTTDLQNVHTRTLNLYEKLPTRWQNRIPERARFLLVWPHPIRLWIRLAGPNTAWRKRIGSWQDIKLKLSDYAGAAWSAIANTSRQAGGAVRNWTLQGLGRGLEAARQLRKQMPTLARWKDKIPGVQRLSRWIDNSLQQMSQSADLNMQQHAVSQLLERGVVFSRELQPEQSGREFVQSCLQDETWMAAQTINKDAIPTEMHANAELCQMLWLKKQLIAVQYPAIRSEGLEAKLRAVGFVLTSQLARKQKISIEMACIGFANMVALSLQEPAKIVAMLELVRVKWKLFHEQASNQVIQAALLSFGRGEIAKDTYHAINQACRSFVPSAPSAE